MISIVCSFDGDVVVAVKGDVDAAVKAMEERFNIQLFDKELMTEGLDFGLTQPWYFCRFFKWSEDTLEPDGDFVIYSLELGKFT